MTEFKAAWTKKMEMLDDTNLTANEIKVMLACRNNEFNDCIDRNSDIQTSCGTWSFTVADNSGLSKKSVSGVMGSLVKKGYCWAQKDPEQDMYGLTDAGVALFTVIEEKPAIKAGDLIEVKAFTGMTLGNYTVTCVTDETIAVEANKGIMVFGKQTGWQLNAKNPRFANKLVLR